MSGAFAERFLILLLQQFFYRVNGYLVVQRTTISSRFFYRKMNT